MCATPCRLCRSPLVDVVWQRILHIFKSNFAACLPELLCRRLLVAGADALRDGGNAVDAAVATSLCQGIFNAMASGAGGGHFMLIRCSTQLSRQQHDSHAKALTTLMQLLLCMWCC
jgi:gamma-glutamyltranspeptidase